MFPGLVQAQHVGTTLQSHLFGTNADCVVGGEVKRRVTKREFMVWVRWGCFFVGCSIGGGFGCPSMYSCIYIIFTKDMHAVHNIRPLFLSPTPHSHSHPRTHLTTQPDRMMSYSQPRTTVAHSFTKTPAVQRSSSVRTMCWECVSAEPFIAGFIVLEEPIPPADDSEHLIGSKCRGSTSQNAVFLAVQYLCVRFSLVIYG